VQYTAPIACPVPVVATSTTSVSWSIRSIHARPRLQLKVTVGRTVRRAAKILTGTEVARASILKVYGDLDEDKVVVVPYAAASEFRPVAREAAVAAVEKRHSLQDRSSCRWGISSRARITSG